MAVLRGGFVLVFVFPVEATHILMFARAIGDDNLAFSDSDSAEARAVGGIVAPPTFTIAAMQFDPEYRFRPQEGLTWPSAEPNAGGDPDSGARLLHAEQSFDFFRPVRPGTVLNATGRQGESWKKESRRGGFLQFQESFVDFHDSEGQLFVTSRMVTVLPQRPVEQEL
jgi:acyl dehydratase